jgi:hypothetical protein
MRRPTQPAGTHRMRRPHVRRAAVAVAVLGLALSAATAAGGGAGERPRDAVRVRAAQGEPPLDPAQFSATVDNPLFPISKLHFTRMSGSERDPDSGRRISLRGRMRRLPATTRVAGFPVTVVQDDEFENGRLAEHTLDYFAQDQAGNVWYFGERIDNYEDGRVVGHEGQWLAGRRGARPGLFMPAHPAVGSTFQQERAPGVAEDRSTVIALGVRVTTPARVFRGCIKTRDFSPLDRATEFKYYCPGVGIAREIESPGTKFDVVRFG